MSFPRYPRYKDSGVEWLGEVPEHWDLKRLKYLGEAITGLTYDPSDLVDEGTGTLVLRSSNVQGGKVVFDDNVYVSMAIHDDLVTRIGDILICSRNGSRALIGKNALVDARSAGLTFGAFMTVFRSEHSDYLACVFNSSVFEFQSGAFLTATINQLTLGVLENFEVPVPPASEREQIANFVKREAAKIDELVAKQERLLELLKEKRQAVISHAVTKGLNPRAPMKTSGIEWLGDVPAHWEVGPLKRYWSVTDCKHVTAEFVDDGVPLASIREVQGRWVDLENAKCTTEQFYEALIEGGRRPLPGDLIFSRNATVGEVAQVGPDHPRFAMGQDVVLLRKLSPKYSSDFLQYVIRSPIVLEQLANMMIGSTFKRVNVEEIRSFILPFPPGTEQEEISCFLEASLEQLDALAAEAQKAIDLLQERRTALISAAVTGKIDVRKLAAA